MRLVLLTVCVLSVACGDDDSTAIDSSTADAAKDSSPDARNEASVSKTCVAPASVSTLPGVGIVVPEQRCEFTQSEAQAGPSFTYQVFLTEEVSVVVDPLDAGGCEVGSDTDPFAVHAVLSNAEQTVRHCRCDTGNCQAEGVNRVVPAGTYNGSFEWKGFAWDGPSDFNQPLGDPLVPGDYVIRVRGEGAYEPLAGPITDYEITAEFPITITPNE